MSNDLGRIIKQLRVTIGLTLRQLSALSGISSSHLGRIERGERFPSARILRQIAKPLAIGEGELFTLAGYLSSQSSTVVDNETQQSFGQVDPYVASVLASEPVAMQHTIIGILTILKTIAKGSGEGESEKS